MFPYRTTTVYLIGESHSQDKADNKLVLDFCRQAGAGWMVATEHYRLTPEYNSVVSAIGDLVCYVYTIICELYIHIVTAGSIDISSAKIFYAIQETLCDPQISSEANKLYAVRYQCPNIIPTLREHMAMAAHKMDTHKCLIFMQFLRNLILRSTHISVKNVMILDFKHLEYVADEKFRDYFIQQLQCELRDQAFVTNIKELAGVARTYGKDRFFVIVGKSHTPRLKEMFKHSQTVRVVDYSYEQFKVDFADYLPSDSEVPRL